MNPNHQRTKREIVNVYIMNENYQEGLALAKENFMRKKTNPFHIQAYFICLLHNNEHNVVGVSSELSMLLDLIQKSLDKKLRVCIQLCMESLSIMCRMIRKKPLEFWSIVLVNMVMFCI